MVYSLPEPLLGLALLALLVLASELGFRAGRRRGPTSGDAVRQQVGNIQTALLALFALLLAFAALAMGVVGYGNGYAGARTLGVTTLLCALTALVVLVIVDLGRPRRGLIRVSQESMVNLQKNLEAPGR
jgi:hypothetical protein